MFEAEFETLLSLLHLSQAKRRRPSVKKTSKLHFDLLEDRVVPAGTGVISGHAFTDLTGNGLSADDTAKGGVDIRLVLDSSQNGHLDRFDVFVGATFTAADGSYSFKNLPAGRYFVVESTPHGFIETAPAGHTYRINLADGQKSTQNDFDYFKRLSESRPADIVYTVVDNGVTHTYRSLDGHTNAGDTVTVTFTVLPRMGRVTFSLVSYNSATPRTQDTVADSQTMTFGPGRHSLTVQIPNNSYEIYFVKGSVIDQFGAPGSHVSYFAQQRVLGADAGQLETPPPPPPPPPPPSPSTLSGTVFDDANHDGSIDAGDGGISGVVVLLNGTDSNGQSVSLSALTNLNGQYSFTGLNPGVYSITQTVPGTFNSEADFLGALGGNLSSPVLIDQIVITGGQTGDNYNFLDQHPVTQQTSSISGTVTEQLNPGDAFVPAEGVNVLLEDSEGNVVASTTTDANGNYIFNNVTAGPGIIYTVFFANPDPTTLRGANTVDVDMSVDPTNATGVDGAFSALLV